MTARAIVDDVLGRGMTRDIWTSSYLKVFPVSVQDFDLVAVLPAVFYMFRFGWRRGKGRFLAAFGAETGTMRERRRAATIARIAGELATEPCLQGFNSEIGQAILSDLLLCFCLENSKKALGRIEQVQRVAPAHYMASWVDLPDNVVNLRYVPEMIVAMLADQQGDYVQQDHEGDRTWFSVGRGFEDNVLLRAFHKGIVRRGELAADLTSDHFNEETPVGLDQLLMIRLAQRLGEAPDKLRGGEGNQVSNQRPICEKASRRFSEDIRHFVRFYSDVVPRHTLVELLESCIAVGMTTMLTSAVELLFEWGDTGVIREACEQTPAPLFVDCSNGVERRLKLLAEQSLGDFFRRLERLPVILMTLRLLDHGARYDPSTRAMNVSAKPYATNWVNLLGELLFKRREEAQAVLYDLTRKAAELAERLEADYPEVAQILRDSATQPNPVWRLAESLTSLQGRKNAQGNVISLMDSSILVNRPNGLARKRTVSRRASSAGRTRRAEVRSLVFSDAVLDYLVHLHVLRNGRNITVRLLSFKEFVQVLRDWYGFCVDEAPPGMTISNDLLRANRAVLERRLRDLGLLIGVNDAETMKYVRPRFDHRREEGHDLD